MMATPALATTGTRLAAKVRAARDTLGHAACEDLAYPIRFIHDQFDYLADSLEALPDGTVAIGADSPVAAILGPSNSEGAMLLYVAALARSQGFRVMLHISHGNPRIRAGFAELLVDEAWIMLTDGRSKSFLDAALADPEVRFIQVFADDSWIEAYEPAVRASGKTVAFEGPGKDPFIVLAGADIDAAVAAALESGLFAGGAACMSPERYYVHVDIADEFVERLARRLEQIVPRCPTQPDAELGYIYSARAVGRMRRQLAEAIERGAVRHTGGEISTVAFLGRKLFACGPVVLTGVPGDCSLAMDETFGPVFPVWPFRTHEEACSLANATPYGLTATVFGPDGDAEHLAALLRRTHGLVYVNTSMVQGFLPEHWGSGGFGRSGWLWETSADGQFIRRNGPRPLAGELARARERWAQ